MKNLAQYEDRKNQFAQDISLKDNIRLERAKNEPFIFFFILAIAITAVSAAYILSHDNGKAGGFVMVAIAIFLSMCLSVVIYFQGKSKTIFIFTDGGKKFYMEYISRGKALFSDNNITISVYRKDGVLHYKNGLLSSSRRKVMFFNDMGILTDYKKTEKKECFTCTYDIDRHDSIKYIKRNVDGLFIKFKFFDGYDSDGQEEYDVKNYKVLKAETIYLPKILIEAYERSGQEMPRNDRIKYTDNLKSF
ncbi:MAG: hypothetical protein LBT20_07040 [Clostridiales bacterium]|jgi:hypothetical protein|nr:hypothetical protein [Clostridiales bacterium]